MKPSEFPPLALLTFRYPLSFRRLVFAREFESRVVSPASNNDDEVCALMDMVIQTETKMRPNYLELKHAERNNTH